MKTIHPAPVTRLVWPMAAVLAFFSDQARSAPSAPESAAGTVQLPAYEVTAPKFAASGAAWREKLDNLGHTTWVNAQGGALVQAIVWRHGYLSLHPGEQAAIFVRQRPERLMAVAGGHDRILVTPRTESSTSTATALELASPAA